MRLQQPLYVDKPVRSIKLKITAKDVPTSAAVIITDVQLQPGEQATGIVPNPREAGTTQGRPQYRNGVVNPGLEVVALSNSDKAAPVRLNVRNAKGNTRIGSYRFGKLNGDAIADGPNHTATHGYGLAPIITERSDLHLRNAIDGRVHLRLAWHERT
ncbi:hypothetical protein [Glutamicibacter creatinolyticus]|uniref:hypothetical protein n=1 Tax=Glutamicibacter creatinolyticus TaxID=162496 RepID=UPI00321690C9